MCHSFQWLRFLLHDFILVLESIVRVLIVDIIDIFFYVLNHVRFLMLFVAFSSEH